MSNGTFLTLRLSYQRHGVHTRGGAPRGGGRYAPRLGFGCDAPLRRAIWRCPPRAQPLRSLLRSVRQTQRAVLSRAVCDLRAPSEAVARHALNAPFPCLAARAQPTRCTCRPPLSWTPSRSTRAPRARRRSCRVRSLRSGHAAAPDAHAPLRRSHPCQGGGVPAARAGHRAVGAPQRATAAPRPPRAHAATNAGAGAGHGDHGAGGAGWRRAGVAGHAGGARCRRRADDGRRCRAGRCGRSGCAWAAHGALPRGRPARCASDVARAQAVAAAGAAAYATTRNDDVGNIARATGKQALTAVEKAKGARLQRLQMQAVRHGIA